MEWKYIKPLNNENIIGEIEEKYNLKLPEVLKYLIKKYNGGRPEKNIFDTVNSKEKVFKCLLSYNRDDRETIYIFDDFFNNGYIPFAITEFGDVICINIKTNVVELYLHELNKFDYVCEGIEVFIDSLY